jgi:dienelactone hydrolase
MAQEADARQIILVGYSGGGTLAVLMGERLEHVAAVITVGANLDIDAWAQHHHYLPLAASLNPAASDRQHSWTEIHLSGASDTVVPSATTSAYFKRYPAAQQWIYPEYDHVCCWVEQWRAVWNRVEEVTK